MMNRIKQIENLLIAHIERPSFKAGDTVAVDFKVREGEKERIQTFQGIVIQRRGGGVTENFTVRKISNGVGVEKIFPLHSPLLESLKVLKLGKVRRARLFYLRKLRGALKVKERRAFRPKKLAAEVKA